MVGAETSHAARLNAEGETGCHIGNVNGSPRFPTWLPYTSSLEKEGKAGTHCGYGSAVLLILTTLKTHQIPISPVRPPAGWATSADSARKRQQLSQLVLLPSPHPACEPDQHLPLSGLVEYSRLFQKYVSFTRGHFNYEPSVGGMMSWAMWNNCIRKPAVVQTGRSNLPILEYLTLRQLRLHSELRYSLRATRRQARSIVDGDCL